MVSNRFENSRDQLIAAFQRKLADGEEFKTITQARSLAESIIGVPVKAGTPVAKAVEEAIEQAIVLCAKDVVNLGLPTQYTYRELVKLYEAQPTLGTRTSKSVQMQAYSTPMPLSYLAGVLAGIKKETSVYEPTAGRGALLLLSSPENVIANESDPDRAKDLRAQGYQVTQHDAALHAPDTSVDVVISNPPFGRRKQNGTLERFQIGAVDTPILTSELDQAIAWKALDVMKDDGRAVLIIGSERGTEKERKQKYNVPRVRKFFFNLYRQYKIESHITVDGSLYKRQGAAFPVDIIVVAGRKLTPHLSPTLERALPAADIPKIYESYEALESFLPTSISHGHNYSFTASIYSERRSMGTGKEQRSPSSTSNAGNDRDSGSMALQEPIRSTDGSNGEKLPDADSITELAASDKRVLQHRTSDRHIHPHRHGHQHHPSNNRQSLSGGKNQRGSPSLSSTSNNRSTQETGSNRSSVEYDSQRVAKSFNPRPIEKTMAAPNAENQDIQLGQVPYKPKSRGKGLDSYVPQNLESGIQVALNNLVKEVGDVDEFVTDQLNFGSVENLHKALAAEQVDGVALAIRSLQQGKAALIGDDTGLGKGRQMASAIKYASERGYIPIFITKDPGLYADMARDLTDIGLSARDIRPFMTNSDEKIPLPDGRVLTSSRASHKREMLQMMESGTLLPQYNMIFSTYDQIQTVKGRDTDRRKFLYAISPQSILVLDEAHAAGGSNREAAKRSGAVDRATFTRSLVSCARGVFFASATATKRPEVMDLYAMRMNIAEITSVQGIQKTLEHGGTPLQQVSTAMMAEDGQYIRRARTYAGVEVGSKVVQTTRSDADQLSEIIRAILEFDKGKKEAVRELNESARAEAKSVGFDNSTGKSGAMSTGFSSIMWNVVDQAALSRKADAVADYAISVLQADEKPFIGVSNTMGAFIDQFAQDMEIRAGDTINVSFQDVLARYLERSRDVTIKDYSGTVVERRPLTESELSVEAIEQYETAERLIDQASFANMPVSPIDWIRYRVESAGYSFGELTGRKSRLDYDADGSAVYQNRSSSEISKAAKLDIIKGFNSGTVDVGLGNRSASTGYSMHASEKFSDQRRRHFLIAQPERDINVFKQFMGRFHRTGQVNAPKISLIVGNTPDEKRPAAVLAKKLASLNANTTAARQGGIDFSDIPDYLNEVGDQVVSDLIRFDAELSKRLHDPIYVTEDSTRPVEGAVAKVTGCLPMLPVAEQEAFYRQLDREYKATLDRYTAMGENPLEATSVDLDARTIGSVEVVEQKEGYSSVFAQGIRAEVVDAKVLSKPKPQIEVINDIRKAVGLPIVRAVEEHDREEVDVLSKQLVNDLYDKTAKVSERYILQQKLKYAKEEESMEKQAGKGDQTKTRVSKQLETLTQIKRFRPGQTVRITSHKDRVLYGAITGIKKKGQSFEKLLSADIDKVENAATPSRWEVVIAIADSQRQIALPLSKMNTATGGAGTYSVSLAPYSLTDGDIYELFDKRQKGDREVRTILTGNLLRLAETTYRSQGDLIVATRSNGKPEPMLLMKPDFNLHTEMQTTPVVLPTADSVHQFMQITRGKGVVQTMDKSITFKQFGANIWLLQTGKPRKDIFLDEGLLEAGETEFVSVADRMEAQVSRNKLDAVMTYLREEQGQSVAAFSNHQEARDLMGIKLPEIQLTDAVETVIEREGLAPSVDMSDLGSIREKLDSAFAQNAENDETAASSQDIPNALPVSETDSAEHTPESITDEETDATPEEIELVDEFLQQHDGDVESIVERIMQGDFQDASDTEADDSLADLADEVDSEELPYDPSWDEYEQSEVSESNLEASTPPPGSELSAASSTSDSVDSEEREPVTSDSGNEPKPNQQPLLDPPSKHRLLVEQRVAKFLHESGLSPGVTAKDDFHLRIENSPWMPLVVEAIDAGKDKFVYLTHYIEQNGDRFHDGEMVFKLSNGKHLTFHESAVRGPVGEVRGYDKNFAAIFAQNIIEQGFIEAAKQQLADATQQLHPVSEDIRKSEERPDHKIEKDITSDSTVEISEVEEPTLIEKSSPTVDSLSDEVDALSDLEFVDDLVVEHGGDEEAILNEIFSGERQLPSQDQTDPLDDPLDVDTEEISDDELSSDPSWDEDERSGESSTDTLQENNHGTDGSSRDITAENVADAYDLIDRYHGDEDAILNEIVQSNGELSDPFGDPLEEELNSTSDSDVAVEDTERANNEDQIALPLYLTESEDNSRDGHFNVEPSKTEHRNEGQKGIFRDNATPEGRGDVANKPATEVQTDRKRPHQNGSIKKEDKLPTPPFMVIREPISIPLAEIPNISGQQAAMNSIASEDYMLWTPPFEEPYGSRKEETETDLLTNHDASIIDMEQKSTAEQPLPVDTELDRLIEDIAYSDDEIDSILNYEYGSELKATATPHTGSVKTPSENTDKSIHSIKSLHSEEREPLVDMTLFECQQAAEDSLYVEDQQTHSALERLLDQHSGEGNIALAASLKETAVENMTEASVKYQYELSEQIIPHAQTFLAKAYKAEVTTLEGNNVSFKGKNYSVEYDKRTKTLEIHVQNSGGYLRSVDGIAEEVKGLTEKDCTRFAAVAQKSQKQIKRMVRGKNSTIEIS